MDSLAQKEVRKGEFAYGRIGRKRYLANEIWKVFSVAEKEYLDDVAILLDMEIIENNPYMRFVSNKCFDIDKKLSVMIENLKEYFTITNERGYLSLIKLNNSHLGCFIEFDRYFFHLLEYYKRTGKRHCLKIKR